MATSFEARLATRISTGVDTRLRQAAILRRIPFGHLVDELLDQVLPSSEELSSQLAALARQEPPR